MSRAQDNWSNQSVKFKVFPGFDTDALRWAASSTFRLDPSHVSSFETRDPLARRIVERLAARQAIKVKEVLESFETFARVHRRLRAPCVADLCCGHGLTGLLFAAVERSVEHVVLLDRQKPPKADMVVEAVIEAAPWVADKVRWVEAPIAEAPALVPRGAAIVAVHACGVRTDRAIDAAVALESPSVALVPCCYAHTGRRAPRAIREALGAEVATDVARTYRLEAAGWTVAWNAIPRPITPMNRVLVATHA
ncbi:MAG: methyltransferase [Sandaracinaceae bacterium]